MNYQKLNGAAKTLLLPIDWGIGFALAHKWSLFGLALLPTVLELIASYVMYSSRLLRQEAMLMLLLSSIANVWLHIAALMLVIELVRGKNAVSITKLGLRAFVALPKPLISYLLTILIISFGIFQAFLIPGLVFIGLLIWAPAFCVGELYAKPVKKRDPDDTEAGAGGPIPFFTGRPPWDLGLARSWRLAGRSFFTSFQLALLFLAAIVVPMAAVDLISDASLGYSTEALKVIFSSLLGALVKGVWAGTFVALIPPDARAEIGIDSYPDLSAVCAPKKVKMMRYEGRLGPQFAVLFLCAVSTWIYFQNTIERTKMPQAVSTELLEAEEQKGELVLTVRLIDPRQEFRWFTPERFRLEFDAPEIEAPEPLAAPPVTGSAAELRPPAAAPPQEPERELLAPTKIVAFDQNGIILPLDKLSPVQGAIKIVLHFQPKKPSQLDHPFALYYHSFSGPGEPVVHGELSSSWS